MSTTDELLEEMLEDAEEYATPVTDDDLQFWIDEHLRVISIPKNGVVAGVEGDKNVNKIKFGMNRYYHGFDMSTFSGRILYSNAKGNKNYYNITDMQASGSTITFSWLVDADAVQYMGKTAFVVYLFKIQGSELRQKFFSTLATLKVLEGMEVDSAVPVEKQTDIIERMKEEISAYAEEVKKSLPADYTAMTEQVSSLKEDLINNIYPLNWTDEMWIDKNGKFNAHPTSKATDYIKIPEWFDLITIISSNIELYCAWYDSNKKFISHPNIVVGENNILKPYNAAYIALTCNESHSLVMKKFDSSQIKDFTNIKKKDGIRPISNTAQEVYNPNPSYEGYKMPAGSLGNCAALYDVSEYAGETVELYGTEMGYILQFSDSPKPSTYIGYKKNADKKSIYKVEIDSNAKYLTVNLFGDAITLKMKTSESYATKGELEKSIPSASKKIWCAIGDSITQGSGASSYSNNYYWKLRSKLINAEAIQGSYNFGSGGSSSESICAYCGMKGLYITDAISIPASDAVQIKLNKSVKDAENNVDYCNPCYLSGVKGNLAYSNGAYTFKRSEEGIEISVASGTALITNAGKKCLSAEVLTIFVGTNDKVDDNVHSIDTSVNNTSQLSKLSKNGKYIVITPYVNSVSDDYRNKMFDTFGQRCIDMYKYFSEQAVYDAITKGLLSTGEQSDWKTLLLTDGVHPNNIGHQLICDKIFERMQILGYF